MSKVDIPLKKAYRLLNHGPVVLVSTTGKDGPNICTVAWSCPAAKDPPRLLLVLGRRHKTFENIMETGEFVVNVPGDEMLETVLLCGRLKGREVDKWQRTGLTPLEIEGVSSPAVADCFAHVACRLVDEDLARREGLVLGQAVASVADPGVMDDDGFIDILAFPTLHHLGSDRFTRPDSLLEP